jgi:hypothetical protein
MIVRWAEMDPGPCPVEDAPHTTCTSPGYVPLSEPVLRAGRPPATIATPVRPLRVPPRVPPAPLPSHTEETFTTTTYRRKKRGRP